MSDVYTVAQHDRELLAAAVTEITGEPVEVGDTFLTFLATLTPATSGGVRFHLYGDGAVEGMYARCGGCGGTVSRHAVGGTSDVAVQYRALRRVAAGPSAGAVTRLRRRMFGCAGCAPETLSAAAA